MMLTEELLEIAGELRSILGSINGAQKVEEACVLSYMVHVKEEADKVAVEEVAKMLVEQADAKGVALEIMAVTPTDIEEAKSRLESLMEKN